MTGPPAHAGWYPDPMDRGAIRYWDGSAWTDRAAATEGSSATVVARDDRTPWQRIPAAVKAGIGVIATILLIVVVAYSIREPDDTPFGMQPTDERAVVELIQQARQEYDAASHDLQRNAVLADRDSRICALLADGRVQNWTGQVYRIDASRDGKGMLGINIEPNTQVATRQHAFVDSDDDTLVGPGPLLDQITDLETGQTVTFSGRFTADEGDGTCFDNPRFTQSQEINKPLMAFRFSDVHR